MLSPLRRAVRSGILRKVRRGELVRVTVTRGVTADSIRRGTSAGRFPFPRSKYKALVGWYSPRERAILRAENVHLGKTLRRHLRNKGWVTSVDEAFDEVVRRCADRPDTWLIAPLREAFGELHQRGAAHSVEVWSPDGHLIGGTFGVQTGGVISVESLFHSENETSKVAVVDLASRLRSAGGVAIDCQYVTPHLEALGATPLDRAAFKRLLDQARGLPVQLPTERFPASRLADPSPPDGGVWPIVGEG